MGTKSRGAELRSKGLLASALVPFLFCTDRGFFFRCRFPGAATECDKESNEQVSWEEVRFQQVSPWPWTASPKMFAGVQQKLRSVRKGQERVLVTCRSRV